MADPTVPNRHVSYQTTGTHVAATSRLVLRSQQNAEAGLREASPCIFENISFKQDALRILEFKQILDDDRIAIHHADESRLTIEPGPRLEQVIVANLDICGSRGGCVSSQQNAFSCGLEKVVHNLEGAHGIIAEPAGNCL